MKRIQRPPEGPKEEDAERYSAVFQGSPFGIAISRAVDGRFCDVNPAFLDLVGYTRDEVIHRTSIELQLWPDLRDRETIGKLLSPGEAVVDFESQYRNKRGDIGNLLVSTYLTEINGERHVISTYCDVTNHKRLEHDLRENQARLRVVLNASNLVVFHQDKDLRYTWIANPALGATSEDILGYTDNEILGAEGFPLTRIKQHVVKTGRATHEEVWVTRQGETGCYDLVVEPWSDSQGVLTGIVCAAADITARKQAQQELETVSEHMKNLALHLQDSLEDERKALAREVHDQLGASLTGIRMRLGSLAASLGSDNQERLDDIAAIAAMAQAAMQSSREICSRLRPPALDDLGLSETCRWYLRDWANMTGLKVKGRFSAPMIHDPNIRVDLFRIFQELLTNIARHANAKSVSCSITAGKQQLRLKVSDDGNGFDTTSKSQGFGLLGVKERAKRHGGTAKITSNTDGTMVQISVPMDKLQ